MATSLGMTIGADLSGGTIVQTVALAGRVQSVWLTRFDHANPSGTQRHNLVELRRPHGV